MRRDDDQLEKYMSEFRPRAVRPLDLPRPPAATTGMKRLAVAAMVLLCAGSGLWYVRRVGTIPSPAPQMPATQVEIPDATGRPNPFSLTKLALEDDRRFEAKLAAQSRLVLPGFQGDQSMLRVLTKE